MEGPNKTKNFIYRAAGAAIKRMRLHSFSKLRDDNRPTAPFKLVFYSGKSGIEYLNASLYSIYQSWKFLPEVTIVSDGTPIEFLQSKLIKWPRAVSIISWEQCANYYKEKGNIDLYTYASKNVYGKKFTGVMYCAEHYPCLYSDTDLLWYGSPPEENYTVKPYFKMSEDVEFCYSPGMLESLHEEDCLKFRPLNAGLIYLDGDFSIFNKWKDMCAYLPVKFDYRSEQTAFAILACNYNQNQYWEMDQIFIDIDDVYSLQYTLKKHPHILARHYVSLKKIVFWRDFFHILIRSGSKKEKNLRYITNKS